MRLASIFRFILCGLTAAPSLSFAVSDPMPLALHTQGNQILDSQNQPVILRGLNAASLEWSSDGEGRILEIVRVAIRDWRANTIRLPLAQDRWFGKAPEQADEGKSYRALVKEIVELCSSSGCYIILDLHWSNAGQWGQNIGQHSMPDQNSVTFWKDVAALYANHPAVIFDLYNEPRDVSWDVWLHGGTVTDRVANRGGQNEVTYQAVGMQELLDVVRSTGAKNVIIVGGLDWAYDYSGILEGRQLKDPNGNGVIYANHAYDNKEDLVEVWIANMKKAAAQFPIIISEFGGSGGPGRRSVWWGSTPSTAIGDDWLLHVMTALQENNWSWTAWNMHTTAGPTLLADWDYTPSPDFGVYVQQALIGKLPPYTPPDPSKLTPPPASTLPESARLGGQTLYGDWQIEGQSDRWSRSGSVLAFAPDSEGKLTGQWITFRGFTNLEDVRAKDNQVTFIQVVRFGTDEYRAGFTGTLEGDTLTGILTHGPGKSEIKGTRKPSVPLAVGTWNLIYKISDSPATAVMTVKANPDGTLSADWQGPQEQTEIADLRYEKETLTFQCKTASKESTFTATIHPLTGLLSGTIKSPQTEAAVEGKRVGADLIGIWALNIRSDRGPAKQRLKINGDMSGVYGTMPIEKVTLDGDTVTFTITSQFGQRRFETHFEGKLDGPSLTGQLKMFWGDQDITGSKISSCF